MAASSATIKPTHDLNPRAKARRDKQDYAKVRRAELQYGVKLRKIARHVGEIINAFPPGDPRSLPEIDRVLTSYAEMLEPWANSLAAGMLADVKSRDDKMWEQVTSTMGEAMREEIRRAPTGEMLRKLQKEQVALITSLPRDAAERVHKLTMEGLSNAARYDEIKKMILKSGDVTESRATLIARTEVGRASTNLGQARAQYVGSEGYVWTTAHDNDVRLSHKHMDGKFVYWNRPPTLDGLTGHAGSLPNCRCFPYIVLPGGYGI